MDSPFAADASDRLTALEALVRRAVVECGDRAALDAKHIVEDAVRRARKRASIFRHKDASLLLQALDQAEEEIGSLPSITAANAAVMSEMRHSSGLMQVAPGSESVQSQGPEFSVLQELADASSSTLPSNRGSSCSSVTAGGGACPSPLEAVAPMRELAMEIASEADESTVEFVRHLSMRKDPSADFRLAQQYDFDTAQSPRSAAARGFRLVPQAHLATPASHVSAPPGQLPPRPVRPGSSPFASGRPREADPEAGVSEGRQCEAEEPEVGHGEGRQGLEEEEVESEAGRQASLPRPIGRRGSTDVHCASADGAPPGLNPLVHVEGCVDHEGDWLAMDDLGCSPGRARMTLEHLSTSPYDTHTFTPPQQVMEELASQLRASRLSI